MAGRAVAVFVARVALGQVGFAHFIAVGLGPALLVSGAAGCTGRGRLHRLSGAFLVGIGCAGLGHDGLGAG